MYVRTSKLGKERLASRFSHVNERYGWNLTLDIETVKTTSRSTTYRVKIGTRESRGHGTRTTASGRHGPWACWHVFRDVFAEWFDGDPDMTIRTGVTTYQGREEFRAIYPATYYTRYFTGSGRRHIGVLCECEPASAVTSRRTTPEPVYVPDDQGGFGLVGTHLVDEALSEYDRLIAETKSIMDGWRPLGTPGSAHP
jgi:hypothetical protein